MTLGQMIQSLRREKGMLQDELAETLGVSRQSVSKWETDAAVPELDKLLRLSELFGVTLDELVRGERHQPTPAAPEPALEPAPPEAPQTPTSSFPPRKIAGTLLLCFAGLVWLLFLVIFGDLLSGLAMASPFLICGAICFIFRRRIGLWCTWAVYALIDAYLQWATGTSRGAIFLPHFYTYGITAYHIIAWALMLGLIVLIAVTLRGYRGMTCHADCRWRNRMLFSGGLALLAYAGKWGASFAFNRVLQAAGSYADAAVPATLLRILLFALDWGMIAALSTLLVLFAAFLRGRKK